MTQKERRFTIEAVAMIGAAFLLAIIIPALINLHDTMAFFAAIFMLMGCVAWGAYFFYRISKG